MDVKSPVGNSRIFETRTSYCDINMNPSLYKIAEEEF